ncbi:hypothetical protein [Bacillus horti]|uniref:Cyclic lactone autoinducer peptide n=1 Tax=Caldalkalibacillus horti TaxID=77523 RepID=A0ABT9W669_9BACI|nr:hypothetical protein [Bacillus horti]MDQ0168559.1 hypothetical protein [Bacillus horti]
MKKFLAGFFTLTLVLSLTTGALATEASSQVTSCPWWQICETYPD